MGRNTWDSINKTPLKNRNNIIVSTTLQPQQGATVVSTLDEAL
jgi:dihydrofolate reductase